jgi:hypothetical protein
MGLCSTASVNSVTLCCPLPYDLRATPLEGGRQNPRKGYGHLPRAHTGRRHDVGLVERVSSANSSPVRLSPLLYYHPGHCRANPDVVGAQDDGTSPRRLLCDSQSSVSPTLEADIRATRGSHATTPQNRSWTDTGLTATSRQKQDSPGWPPTPRH